MALQHRTAITTPKPCTVLGPIATVEGDYSSKLRRPCGGFIHTVNGLVAGSSPAMSRKTPVAQLVERVKAASQSFRLTLSDCDSTFETKKWRIIDLEIRSNVHPNVSIPMSSL